MSEPKQGNEEGDRPDLQVQQTQAQNGGSDRRYETKSMGNFRHLLRRLPLLVIVVALAWLFLGDRPRPVTLVYDLPDDPPAVRVQVWIRAPDGSTPAAISWGDGKLPASDRQEQRAVLTSGRHRLLATLEFANGSKREIERDLEIAPSDERIVVHF